MREIITPEGIVETYFDSLSEWQKATTKEDFLTCGVEWNGGYYHYQDAYKDASSSNKFRERIEKLSFKLVNMIQASAPDIQPSFDVTGLGFDVGLALAGVPECWVTMQQSKDPKVVRILYNASVSAGISTEQIIKKGVAVCALIQCLEMANISTEVVLCFDSRPHSAKVAKEGVRCFVTYKQAGEYFDLEKFAWGVCSPAFFRVLGFNWIYTRTLCNRDDGLPWPNPRIDGKEWDIYFGHMYLYDSEFQSEESTIQWVVAKCMEYGVEITNPLLK
jgi:hypothetical protein